MKTDVWNLDLSKKSQILFKKKRRNYIAGGIFGGKNNKTTMLPYTCAKESSLICSKAHSKKKFLNFEKTEKKLEFSE